MSEPLLNFLFDLESNKMLFHPIQVLAMENYTVYISLLYQSYHTHQPSHSNCPSIRQLIKRIKNTRTCIHWAIKDKIDNMIRKKPILFSNEHFSFLKLLPCTFKILITDTLFRFPEVPKIQLLFLQVLSQSYRLKKKHKNTKYTFSTNGYDYYLYTSCL